MTKNKKVPGLVSLFGLLALSCLLLFQNCTKLQAISNGRSTGSGSYSSLTPTSSPTSSPAPSSPSITASTTVASTGFFDAQSAFRVGPKASDNGPLINSALQSCLANGGGTVILPAGDLKIATPIQMVTNCKLKGAGRGNPDYSGYSGSPANPITVLDYVGDSSATGVIQFNASPSAQIVNSGVADLSINGNVASAGGLGLAGIYLNGTVNHCVFGDLDFYQINEGIHEDNVGNTAGTPAGNVFSGAIFMKFIYVGLEFTGGTSEHYQHVEMEYVVNSGIGVDFRANCDSNQIDYLIVTTQGNPGSTAKGIVYNSGSPGKANDIFNETITFAFLNISQPATESSAVVNYTGDGNTNQILALELGYQAPQPSISAHGFLNYNELNGFSVHSDILGFTSNPFGVSRPSGDSTYCQAGGGYAVDPRSTNNRGIITVGSAATACIVSFGGPVNGVGGSSWPSGANPVCVVSDNTSNAALRVSLPSNQSFTVSGLTAGDTFSWVCL